MKPMWPSLPIPSTWRSIPPTSLIWRSYAAAEVGGVVTAAVGSEHCPGREIEVIGELAADEHPVGLGIVQVETDIFVEQEHASVGEADQTAAVAIDEQSIHRQRRAPRGQTEHRALEGFEEALDQICRDDGRFFGAIRDDDFHERDAYHRSG